MKEPFSILSRALAKQQLPQKIKDQIKKAGLPQSGNNVFEPKLVKNRRGTDIIEKTEVKKGPKKGKKGWVDTQGRIWIRDRAHSGLPDHWDVQIDEGDSYIRVDNSGNKI